MPREDQPLKRRLVMIGEAPGPSLPPDVAFAGKSGEFLASKLGLDVFDFEIIAKVNLIYEHPGRDSKGSKFPQAEAAAAASMLARLVASHENYRYGLVLAGKRVARAFGIKKPEYFAVEYLNHLVPERLHWKWTAAWTIPHPSGVNRWWNDKKNLRTARRRIKKILNWRLEVDWTSEMELMQEAPCESF